MQTQYVAGLSRHTRQYDVAESQVANLAITSCQFGPESDMVSLGRTQAAYKTYRGRLGSKAAQTTLQKDWSRGCRRARRSFLPLALLPSWQLAHPSKKKLSMLTSPQRSRSSRFSKANTATDLSGRTATPAPHFPLTFGGVAC